MLGCLSLLDVSIRKERDVSSKEEKLTRLLDSLISDYSARGWAQFFMEELAPQDAAFFAEKMPEVMTARAQMSGPEFEDWFLHWARTGGWEKVRDELRERL